MTTEVIPQSQLPKQNPRNQNIKFSEPVDILGLVRYQEGAVISRTLINCESGTVTLFAFDEGQGLSEHKSPYDALVQVLEGTAEIVVSGKSARLTKEQMITLPANEPHAVNAISKFKMLLTMIRSR
jgi:quercetin dioxygenase-like cupin family protein